MSPRLDFTHANAAFLPPGYKYPHLYRRVFLGGYYPPFRDRVFEAKARAAERGFHYWSEFGFRSIPLQNQMRAAYLAAQFELEAAKLSGDPARIAAAEAKARAHGKAAPGGSSAHNFGLGDDSALDADSTPANGLQPTWEPARYEVLGEELARVGLDWGQRYGDRPHANWPECTSAAQLRPLLQVWNSCSAGTPDDERLRAVWAQLDARRSALILPYEPRP